MAKAVGKAVANEGSGLLEQLSVNRKRQSTSSWRSKEASHLPCNRMTRGEKESLFLLLGNHLSTKVKVPAGQGVT